MRTSASGALKMPVAPWEVRYRRFVIAADLAAVLIAISFVAIFFNHGDGIGHRTVAYACVTALVAIGGLVTGRAWESYVLGQGAEEFRRLGRSLFGAMVLLALVALGLHLESIRPWVFGAMPLIGLIALPERYILRQLLHYKRRNSRCLIPVMAAGSVPALADLIARIRREPHNGWRIEAVCCPEGESLGEIDGVPVVGTLADFPNMVRLGGYRVAAVAPDAYWTPRKLQELAWSLEGSTAEMVVAPMLMEVAGPRLHVSPVFGLPLLRVTEPVFTGARRVVKEIQDRTLAALLILLCLPVFLGISLAIWLDDRGPAFYTQRRVGRDGKSFTILKFRTMVVNAHAKKAALDNEGAGLLFKMKRDPRITNVGSFLRRYSLDELPQLFNVVTGSMSLIGPRPPLPEEAEQYAPDVRRRLLVKPGMTGLWQVSGRSDLPWDESVRLDLRYVEDWSLALDAVILWKTVWAVVRGQGAY
ncbi:sugar transferase [Pseudonocardiaceae bacterium YIM PH 21723]|nr:sugar transferase [Pseudonocardiaceae bacterium YIM PH 21723]